MSVDINKTISYFDNQFVQFNDAKISIASSAVLYGLGVYTVNCLFVNATTAKRYLFRLPEHYNRLVNSCKIMGFESLDTIISLDDFINMNKRLVELNNLSSDAAIRSCVFVDELIAGTRINNLKTNFYSFVYDLPEMYKREGSNLCFSSWKRINDMQIPPRAKVNGMYAATALIKNEALLNGYDDALILDDNGHLTESTVANIFIVRSGVLYTPKVTSDLLPGITRSTIQDLAKYLNYEVIETDIDRSECYIADEIFICGSSARISPVISIDKRQIADGKPGKITLSIQSAFKSLVTGELSIEQSSNWLIEVPH